jgi:hypothetical protein
MRDLSPRLRGTDAKRIRRIALLIESVGGVALGALIIVYEIVYFALVLVALALLWPADRAVNIYWRLRGRKAQHLKAWRSLIERATEPFDFP